MKKQKVVFAVSLKEESFETFQSVKNYDVFEGSEFHLVHIFKVDTYINELSSYIYPAPEQYTEIEATVMSMMAPLADKIQTQTKSKKVFKHCLFDHNPKERMCHYLKEVNADLVVVTTRGKHGIIGLFTSSFSDHLNKFSPCDIYILRPRPNRDI